MSKQEFEKNYLWRMDTYVFVINKGRIRETVQFAKYCLSFFTVNSEDKHNSKHF